MKYTNLLVVIGWEYRNIGIKMHFSQFFHLSKFYFDFIVANNREKRITLKDNNIFIFYFSKLRIAFLERTEKSHYTYI